MGFLSSLFGFGSSKAQPATQTVVQSQKLPPEISPFVEEIAQEAQDLFKQRVGEGYVPFTGETIAQFAPQEEAAMAGIEGLVGTSRPLQEEALGVTRGLAEKFTPEKAQEYMSPYQKAVTDIEQREAQTRFEREVLPRFEASAVQAGGMSGLGTRAGVEAAELQRGQSQLLADIETRGLQSAFQDAQNQFAQQKQREGQMASEIGRAGPAMLASGLQEAGALQSVGAEKRERDQSTLDDAYFKFLEGQRHPEQNLAEYSGFIYGNPLSQMPTQTQTGTSTPYQPSLGQSLLSIGSNLGAAALRGGLFNRAGGGYIDRDRGLSGLPMFRRQAGTQVIDEDVIVDDTTEIEGITEEDLAPAPALKDPQSVTDILAAMKAGTMKFPGEEAPEVVRKRSAETSQKYTDLINKIYPESQNAFLADALQAFGSAVVSEGDFGKAFNDTFIKLQEVGIKRQDAKRIALGKVGIENLGRSEKVEEFIRKQPKRIRDALIAAADKQRKIDIEEREIQVKEKGKPSKRQAVAVEIGSPEFDIYRRQIELLGESYEKIDPKIGKHLQDLDNATLQALISRALNLKAELGDSISPDEAVHRVVTDAIKRFGKTGGKELGREGWLDTIIQYFD